MQYVDWGSSRVMWAAAAREAILHGAMRDSDVEEYVNIPQQEDEMVLRMADMTPFLRNSEELFQQEACLEIRRSRVGLPTSCVVYHRDEKGAVKDATFFFPKISSSGFPTIAKDETAVEFHCKIADTRGRVDFKPQRMVDQFGIDL